MSDRIDLSDQIAEICSRLGVEYGLVSEITLLPATASVRQFKVNEDGGKYVDMSSEEPADEVLTFEIRS